MTSIFAIRHVPSQPLANFVPSKIYRTYSHARGAATHRMKRGVAHTDLEIISYSIKMVKAEQCAPLPVSNNPVVELEPLVAAVDLELPLLEVQNDSGSTNTETPR